LDGKFRDIAVGKVKREKAEQSASRVRGPIKQS
jgi:hypothetical protein